MGDGRTGRRGGRVEMEMILPVGVEGRDSGERLQASILDGMKVV